MSGNRLITWNRLIDWNRLIAKSVNRGIERIWSVSLKSFQTGRLVFLWNRFRFVIAFLWGDVSVARTSAGRPKRVDTIHWICISFFSWIAAAGGATDTVESTAASELLSSRTLAPRWWTITWTNIMNQHELPWWTLSPYLAHRFAGKLFDSEFWNFAGSSKDKQKIFFENRPTQKHLGQLVFRWSMPFY